MASVWICQLSLATIIQSFMICFLSFSRRHVLLTAYRNHLTETKGTPSTGMSGRRGDDSNAAPSSLLVQPKSRSFIYIFLLIASCARALAIDVSCTV